MILARLLKSMWRSRGAERRLERALYCYRVSDYAGARRLLGEALHEAPRDTAVLTRLALVEVALGRAADAAALLERALGVDPQNASAHCQYALLHRDSGRPARAIAHLEAACRARPDFAEARGELLYAHLQVCDWPAAAVHAQRLREFAERAPPNWMESLAPLTALLLDFAPEVCRQVAECHAAQYAADVEAPVTQRAVRASRPRRLKIGYFSADLGDHAVGRLLNAAFALHDRERFEIHAYSFGGDSDSPQRRTIAASVDRFVDITAHTDAQAAAAIADAGVDILVDMMGHTARSRLGVLARRPAAVQAHFLGYPATTGARYIDYYVADRVAAPPDAERRFTERLALVPDCYLVGDGADARGVSPAARAEHGLPEDAYVYANFSASMRLDRATFGLWMRILDAVPGSVLWLPGDEAVSTNLRREATAAGVDPVRLVFGRRVPDKRAHLARLGCADLALDTLGWYNGHTTSADMLWAGVPVLTSLGDTFATRVAASLVTAAGLPELACATQREYVDTAIALGLDRERSRALRDKLAAARGSAPLFRADRLVQGLELTYDAMWLPSI